MAMKHVGKMKNNGARVVVVFRTLPGDPYNALVVGTGNLGESYHDSLMSLVQSDAAQQTYELGEILSVRKFPDGNNMLSYLHGLGLLKKVPTTGVLMNPTPNTSIPLDELNVLIAEQKGISLEDLALNENGSHGTPKKKDDVTRTTSSSVNASADDSSGTILSPTQMRSKADKLFKEAQSLRKQADELDPPKSKSKSKKTVEVE
jgi:hypothetical protein